MTEISYKGEDWEEGESNGGLHPTDPMAVWHWVRSSPGVSKVAEVYEPQECPQPWNSKIQFKKWELAFEIPQEPAQYVDGHISHNESFSQF